MANYGSVGGQPVYYDARSGQYYTQAAPGTNPLANSAFASLAAMQARSNPKKSNTGLFGTNNNPQPTAAGAGIVPRNYMPSGLTAYGTEPVTPAARPAPFTGQIPQFNMGYIQQLLTQRMGGQTPQMPQTPAMPRTPTLTPGAQGLGGLAALRGISAGNVNPTGGTPNAGV